MNGEDSIATFRLKTLERPTDFLRGMCTNLTAVLTNISNFLSLSLLLHVSKLALAKNNDNDVNKPMKCIL